MLNLSAIHDRFELLKGLDFSKREVADEHYCITENFECGTFNEYYEIAKFAKKKGFEVIYDIGCACAHQAESVISTNLDYVGVNENKLPFWRKGELEYIIGEYPKVRISPKLNSIAVAILSLSFMNVFSEKDVERQFKALSEDFEAAFLFIDETTLPILEKYFITKPITLRYRVLGKMIERQFVYATKKEEQSILLNVPK